MDFLSPVVLWINIIQVSDKAEASKQVPTMEKIWEGMWKSRLGFMFPLKDDEQRKHSNKEWKNELLESWRGIGKNSIQDVSTLTKDINNGLWDWMSCTFQLKGIRLAFSISFMCDWFSKLLDICEFSRTYICKCLHGKWKLIQVYWNTAEIEFWPKIDGTWTDREMHWAVD